MSRRRLLAGVAVCGAVAVAALATSPAAVVDRVTTVADDPLRFFALLCLLAVVRPALAWPTSLLSLLSGFAYGLPGVLPAVGLLTATAVPPYLFGGRGRAEALAGDGRLAAAVARLDAAESRAAAVAGEFRTVTVARLAPLPSDVVSAAAGVSGVSLSPFLAGTAVGEVPWIVAAVAAGASLQRVTAGGLAAAVHPPLIAAAALAGCLLLVGPLYRHYGDETPESAE